MIACLALLKQLEDVGPGFGLGHAEIIVGAARASAFQTVGWDSNPDLAPYTEGIEVRTRGPVHEAFAEPVIRGPRPSEKLAKGPPEAIDELPPEQKPDQEDARWIPGYWGWDDEAKEFLWVSGTW